MLAASVMQSLPDLLLHFRHALGGVHVVKQAEPPVVSNQGRRLLFVRPQPRRYNFFAVVRPLKKLAAVHIAAPLGLRGTVVEIINLSARLARAPASDAPENQGRIDRQMNHDRPPETMLLQQLAQVLRLSDGARKTVE